MSTYEKKPCGKVIHTTNKSARMHSDSLKERYGKSPNMYKCMRCSEIYNHTIIHVGYGYDAAKLNKKARRHHRAVGSRKRKRDSRLLSELAGEA
jgi:hypothetical protein